MSQGIVLDASVALKLVLEEQFSHQATALLTQVTEAKQQVFAPTLLPLEMVSALYQRARRFTGGALTVQQGGITFEQAEGFLGDFLALDIDFVAPAALYERTFTFARSHSLPSTYDASYVVLAQMLGVELWTADQKLIIALGTVAPWVRWIGDYPVPQP